MSTVKKVPLSAIISMLNQAQGGKRVDELRDRVMTALTYSDSRYQQPQILAMDAPLSIGSDANPIMSGQYLLIPSDIAPTQVCSYMRIWGTTTNYCTLHATVPGHLGDNISVTIVAGAGESVVDSDLDTSNPKVVITYNAGVSTINSMVSLINTPATGSQLLRIVKTNTGGTLAAKTIANLAGGEGEGVKIHIGQLTIQNAFAHGATFAGSSNKSRSVHWDSSKVVLYVDKDDLVAGKAFPTGATPSVGGTLRIRLEWSRPEYVCDVMANLVA